MIIYYWLGGCGYFGLFGERASGLWVTYRLMRRDIKVSTKKNKLDYNIVCSWGNDRSVGKRYVWIVFKSPEPAFTRNPMTLYNCIWLVKLIGVMALEIPFGTESLNGNRLPLNEGGLSIINHFT
jgi:hypothetical protein